MRTVLIASITLALAGGSAAPSAAQAPKPVALVVVDVHAVALGYRVSQLIHRAVTNDKGEEIGKIDDLIVGQDKVLFAVIGVGGFLGVGEHLIAVPYTSLRVSGQKIVLAGASKAAVQKLPQFHYAK